MRIGWERDTVLASSGFYADRKYAHDWIVAVRYGVRGEATTLNSPAIIHRRLGRHDNAVAYLNRALRIPERTGDRSDQGMR